MNTVQILGAGWSWGAEPPLNPTSEIWSLNNVMYARYGGAFDQWSRWFDLHPTAHIQQHRPQAYAWYQRQSGSRPIYQWDVNPEIPGSVAYPRADVQAFFAEHGHDERDFWGSLSWMLALAIVEGFEQIDLIWWALVEDGYQKQVPSARYWIGQARGRGIRVQVHGTSHLSPQGPLYGCEALSEVV